MLSALNGLVDRNFIVGFLLPSLIAALLGTWLFQNYPFVSPVWEIIRNEDGFAKFGLVILATWTVATLLSVFSIQLHRLLEGYNGPLSGMKRSRRFKAAFLWKEEYFRGLARKVEAGEFDMGLYLKLYSRFLLDYPRKEAYVMPSRYGNLLSSMETYSLELYGADGASLWPRLIAVMPDGYQKLVEAARAEVDFFVSGVYLSLLLCALCAVSFVWSIYAQWHDGADIESLHLIGIFAFALLAVAAYEGAIMRARGWGGAVRSAYDLYLSDLAKQLGYVEPADPEQRKVFWKQYSSMVVYATKVEAKYRDRAAPPAPPPPCCHCCCCCGNKEKPPPPPPV